jgi:RNA polymerase primary sigma factor
MRTTQEATTIQKAQAGDQEALSEVLKSQERVVRHVANRMGRVSTSYEDLVQAGNIGVIIALQSFDLAAGYKLSTYARPFIFEEVSKAVAESRQGFAVPNGTAKRYWRCVNASQTYEEALALAVAEGMDSDSFLAAHHALTGVVSIDRPYNDEDGDGAGYEVADVTQDVAASVTELLASRSLLAQGFQVLSERERTILEMAYGLNGHPDDLTDGDIADALGVDRSRINRIRNRALTKVREALTDTDTKEA